ncbi:MAG: hypothetical protein ACTSRC_19240 [Candidatus Helarchaeota archaeon]
MVGEINIDKFRPEYIQKDGCSTTVLKEFIEKIRSGEVSTLDLYEFCRVIYDIFTAKELIDQVGDIQRRIGEIVKYSEKLNDSDPEIKQEASKYIKLFVPGLQEELKKLKEIIKTDIDRQPPITSMSELSGYKIIRSKKCLGRNQVRVFDNLLLLTQKNNYDLIRNLIIDDIQNIESSLYNQKLRVLLKSNDPKKNQDSLLIRLKAESTINLPIIPGSNQDITLRDVRNIISYTPFINWEIDEKGDEFITINTIVFKTVYSVLFEYFGQDHVKTRRATTNFFLWLWTNSIQKDDREIITQKYIIIFVAFFLKNIIIHDDRLVINIDGVSIEDEESLQGLAEISTELLVRLESSGRITMNDVRLWLRVFEDRISSLFGVGDIQVDIDPHSKQEVLRYERSSTQFSYIPLIEAKLRAFLKSHNVLKDILKMVDMKGVW